MDGVVPDVQPRLSHADTVCFAKTRFGDLRTKITLLPLVENSVTHNPDHEVNQRHFIWTQSRKRHSISSRCAFERAQDILPLQPHRGQSLFRLGSDAFVDPMKV